jgi:hypothetical protein
MFQSLNKIRLVDITIVSLLVAILAFVVTLGYSEHRQKQAISVIDETLQLKVPKEKVISYERAIDPETKEEVISYIYTTDKVVVSDTYQGHREDIGKRSNNSRVYQKPSDDPEVENYVGKFYTGHPFQLDEGVWKETDNATTTATAFLLQIDNTLLDEVKGILGRPVFAATDTTYSGVGDGHIYGSHSSSWNTAHDAATGDAVDYTGVSMSISTEEYNSDDFDIFRGFLPFDTSALDDDAIISAVDLNIYVPSKDNEDNDGNDFITVIQTTQASNTSLITADYNQAGATNNPTEGVDVGQRKDLTIISTLAYLTFSLNDTGIGWVSKTGYTNLGLREGHDVVDEEIANGTYSRLSVYTSERTGTSEDPYLTITYVIEYPTKFKIDTGRLKIDGGRLKID